MDLRRPCRKTAALARCVALVLVAACGPGVESRDARPPAGDGGDVGTADGARADASDDGGGSDAGVVARDGAADAMPPPTRVCPPGVPCLAWPLPGVDAQDWVINNYVDLDGGPGLRDYTGATGAAAKTYNGHQGVDVDVPTFRAMDADFPVTAAHAGVVTERQDGFPDRNVTCASDDWNVVRVRHADGTEAVYGHLKRGSVVVALGARVVAGQRLGVVGSSGCSTAPHLHFEFHDAAGNVVDPFRAGMWLGPPAYATRLGVMDVALRAGSFSSADQIKDPLPNATQVRPGAILGVGLSVAGGRAAETVGIALVRPGGGVFRQVSLRFEQTYRHSYWYWNLPMGADIGRWRVQVLANGVVRRTLEVQVSN